MDFARSTAKRLLDVVGRGVPLNAENVVVAALCCSHQCLSVELLGGAQPKSAILSGAYEVSGRIASELVVFLRLPCARYYRDKEAEATVKWASSS